MLGFFWFVAEYSVLFQRRKFEDSRRSAVHLQANGLLVSASDRGLELDSQSHDDGSCARLVLLVGLLYSSNRDSGVS